MSSIVQIRRRWAEVQQTAARASALAEAVADDLRHARTAEGQLLLPAGCEGRLADFAAAAEALGLYARDDD